MATFQPAGPITQNASVVPDRLHTDNLGDEGLPHPPMNETAVSALAKVHTHPTRPRPPHPKSGGWLNPLAGESYGGSPMRPA